MMAKYLRENRVQVQEPKVTIDYYLKGESAEGLKEKEQKLRQSRDELSKEVTAQVEQIRRQEQAVKGELEAQAATIGSLISSQILRRPTR